MVRKKDSDYSDIPQWFKLENYDRVVDFKIADWAMEIGIRHFIHADFLAAKETGMDIDIQNPTYCWPAVQSHGLIGSRLKGIRVSPIGDPAISNLTPKDLGSLKELEPDSASQTTPTIIYADHGLATGFIAVRLRATDEQIKSEFADWLQHVKTKINSESQKTPLHPIHTNKWARQKLLPFIDLHLAMLIYGRTITDQAIANALFPNQTKGSDNVRNPIRPNAMNLLYGDWFFALQFEAQSLQIGE